MRTGILAKFPNNNCNISFEVIPSMVYNGWKCWKYDCIWLTNLLQSCPARCVSSFRWQNNFKYNNCHFLKTDIKLHFNIVCKFFFQCSKLTNKISRAPKSIIINVGYKDYRFLELFMFTSKLCMSAMLKSLW